MDMYGYVQIPDYPEYYINERGDIYSSKVKRVLKSRPNTRGYWFITFTYNCKLIQLLVHRLVAHAFMGLALNGTNEVHHINGDVNNNSLHNPEILTKRDHRDRTILAQNKRNWRDIELVCECGNKIGKNNTSGICIKCIRANGVNRTYYTQHMVVPPHQTIDDFNLLFATFGRNWAKLGGLCGMSDKGLQKIYNKLI